MALVIITYDDSGKSDKVFGPFDSDWDAWKFSEACIDVNTQYTTFPLISPAADLLKTREKIARFAYEQTFKTDDRLKSLKAFEKVLKPDK